MATNHEVGGSNPPGRAISLSNYSYLEELVSAGIVSDAAYLTIFLRNYLADSTTHERSLGVGKSRRRIKAASIQERINKK